MCKLQLSVILAALVLAGCASRRETMDLPKVRIQETTNTVAPVWPK